MELTRAGSVEGWIVFGRVDDARAALLQRLGRPWVAIGQRKTVSERLVLTMLLTVSLVLGAAGFAGAAPRDWYVATHAVPAVPHDSWANAFTNIQDALDAAGDGDTIRLAGHTFSLTNPLVWTTAGLTVRGGYEADPDGASPGNHDPALWPTVIERSGAFNHRIMHINGADNSTLENLILTGGNASHTWEDVRGGGLRITSSSSVLLSGCTIRNNRTWNHYPVTTGGGGLYIHGAGSVTLTNCVFRDNSAINTHGGNSYARGGGIWADGGTLALYDCRILENRVSSTLAALGGGLYFAGTSMTLKNSLIALNASNHESDGLCVADGNAQLINCTITDHYAAQSRRGVGIHHAGGTLVLTNCIVWNNAQDIVGEATASFSNVGDQDYGGNNISADPLFEYGYYLATNSPCIGVGSDTAGNLGMADYTTRTDGAPYAEPGDTVNLGWHYPPGTIFDLTYADIYVSPEGDDGDSGTNTTEALRTLTRALTLARDGTRIHVATGHYARAVGETFPLELIDKTGVQILATNAADTVIDASGGTQRVFTLTRAHRAVLQNLTVTGGNDQRIADSGDPPGQGGGVRIEDSATVLLSGCMIISNACSYSWYSSASGGGLYAADSRVTLINCLIRANTASGPHTTSVYGGGIWSDGVITLIDCRILENRVWGGGQGYGQYAWGAGLYFNGKVLTVRNTLVAANRAQHYGDGLCVVGGTANLLNCTIADHFGGQTYRGDGIYRAGGTLALTNCIVWNNAQDIAGLDTDLHVTAAYSLIGTGDYADGGNNISVDPLFEYGYYLADGSPCIGIGSDTAGNLGLANYSTRTDGAPYADPGDTVDLGWHVPAGAAVDLTYADIYVSPLGDDGNSGTNAVEALRTVTRALMLARDWSRIHVAAGHYTRAVGETPGETFPLKLTDRTGLQILATNAAATVLDANGAGVRVMTLTRANHARLANITFTGGHIPNLSENANYVGGAISVSDSGPVVFSGCGVTNNSLTRNWNAGIAGGGLHFSNSDVTLTNCLVRDNTVSNSRTDRPGAIAGGIWSNGDDIVGTDTDVHVTAAYALIGTGAYADGGNNQTGDPLFVDAEAGDYRLRHGSPAIDTGLNQDWMIGATDLGGLPRILMGRVDRGCYETIPPRGILILFR